MYASYPFTTGPHNTGDGSYNDNMLMDDTVIGVEMPRVLFIPDRFTDYRMWDDLPDRIHDRAETVHGDQYLPIPWATADEGFVDQVRRLARGAGFDVVTGAGQAARFAFAVAEAGLARGLVLFYPTPDRRLDEVDLSDLDLTGMLDPYLPIAAALEEGDPSHSRDILLKVIRDTAPPGVEPEELERVLAMMSDHAGELFAYLRAAAVPEPDAPWLERPWIDRLADLAIPVTAVVDPRGQALAAAIARRAPDAEIVIASPRMTPVPGPGQAAEILVRMLGRVGSAPAS